jgi:1,4-dihydroxy-2-naphthoyl-CoA hydrolase
MSDNQVSADPAADGQSRPETPAAPTFEPELGLMTSSALTKAMGIVIVEATPERVVATMPVEGNTQPFGLLHGGASCVLAETLGSVGATLHGARSGKFAVGIDINATHHRGADSGSVTATATALQLGGSLASYEIVIRDEADRRICTARLTCLLRPLPNG